ncbi:MAG: HAD-IA family hydrolase [SAR324 cluster bacterium]|nr:HAD-IA family hydrolase [SAR324 cluster bacterium]
MVKAIFWDFGGVLTTSPFDAFNRYERAHQIPENTIRKINSKNPENNAWARFENSQISLDEFDAAFADESSQEGFSIRGRTVIELLSGKLVPEMVDVLRRCKMHYKNACLTNNVKAGAGAAMQSSESRAAEVRRVMELFDVVIESSKIGIRKPDPKFYQIACEKLSLDPKDVIYLDDLGINLKPAKKMGMITIKVLNPRQAIAALQTHLPIPISGFQN